MTQEDIIRMAREAGSEAARMPDLFPHLMDVFERFAALVAAAERNSWPAEMEAMERQVNILTDALAQAKAEEREASAMRAWALVFGLTADEETANTVLGAMRTR